MESPGREGTHLAQGLPENSGRPAIKANAFALCSDPRWNEVPPCDFRNLDIHESNLTASVFSVVSPVIEVYFSGAGDDQLQLSRIEDRY